MVVVAIAGGTGNVGRTIVDAFKEDGKHEVIILARKVSEAVLPSLADTVSLTPAGTRREVRCSGICC